MQVVFKTRIYHCNVDSSGNVSLDILKDSWSPALTIAKVLIAVKSIFTNPNPCEFPHFLDSLFMSLYASSRLLHMPFCFNCFSFIWNALSFVSLRTGSVNEGIDQIYVRLGSVFTERDSVIVERDLLGMGAILHECMQTMEGDGLFISV